MKKFICALLILLMLAVGLVGCGKQSDTTAADGREKVTIALWGNDLLENYTTYLCKTFPNVEFKFVLATNSIDYYRYLKEHDDLPDIMTVRRFSMRDAAMLKDSLYDLCNTDLAATYYGTYLDSYTYDDGTVNWLPACAEVDSIIINKSLFQEHNIAVPKDYASFIAACKAFEALGIRGFAPDYAEDYTCMETLQGFSISQLNSIEGREWRQQYESGKTDQLSEKVWLPVFEKFFDLKEKAGLGKAETELKNVHPKKKYVAGKQAMYRGTGADVITYTARRNDESLLLPYFGDTERDDWYLTYPVFQVAASKKSMEDPKRRKLILQIMQAMLSQDGQNNISHGKNMIPYNKNVSLELLPSLKNLKPYIQENKMYIRLASNEMFRISRDVVQKIMKGELATPKEAFAAFNAQMAKDTAAEPVVAHIKTAYSNDFTAKHGNQAASAVYNTIRHEIGTDLLLIQGCYASGNVYAGDYTEKELAYLIHNDASWPMIAKLTGDQIYQLVEILLTKKDGYGVVCNDSTLYVSSGFEMDITKTRDGYRLNELTRNGRPLDRKARYSLLLIGDYGWTQELVVNEIGCTDYNCDLDKCNVYLYKHLAREGGQLAEPTDYITLR